MRKTSLGPEQGPGQGQVRIEGSCIIPYRMLFIGQQNYFGQCPA